MTKLKTTTESSVFDRTINLRVVRHVTLQASVLCDNEPVKTMNRTYFVTIATAATRS